MTWVGLGVIALAIFGLIIMHRENASFKASGVPSAAQEISYGGGNAGLPSMSNARIWVDNGRIFIAVVDGKYQVRTVSFLPGDIEDITCQNLDRRMTMTDPSGFAVAGGTAGYQGGGMAGSVLGGAIGGAIGGVIGAAFGPRKLRINLTVHHNGVLATHHLEEKEAGISVMAPLFHGLNVPLK